MFETPDKTRAQLVEVEGSLSADECNCDYELVEDGAVQRKRWFHEPDCSLAPLKPRCENCGAVLGSTNMVGGKCIYCGD